MSTILGPNNEINNNSNVSGLITDSLLMWYDAARSYSYPDVGATWTDLSSNSRNVTFYNAGGTTYSANPTGAPTFSTGNGGHFVFDGSNDFGVVTQFTLPAACSFSVWIKFTGSGEMGIFSHCNGGSVGLAYTVSSGKMEYNYYIPAGWQSIYGTSTVNSGTWKNLVWTKTGVTLKMYINGSLDADLTVNNDANNGTYAMRSIGSKWGPCYSDSYGPGSDSYPSMFSGSMATFMVHSRVLSLTEIERNYTVLKKRFGL